MTEFKRKMEVKTDTPKMNWESRDLSNAFKKFKEHCEFMFKGPLATKTEEIKCNYLMIWAGEKGRQIFSTWTMSDDDKKKLKSYFEKFEEYCRPKSNIIYNRYMFKNRVQGENEPFEQFVTDLKSLLVDCDYRQELHDEMIRDHIVFGVKSPKIREKLIMEGSQLTLEKCLDIAHTLELGRTQAQAIGGQVPQQVDVISRHNGRGNHRTQKRDDRNRQPPRIDRKDRRPEHLN